MKLNETILEVSRFSANEGLNVPMHLVVQLLRYNEVTEFIDKI